MQNFGCLDISETGTKHAHDYAGANRAYAGYLFAQDIVC